MSAPDARLSAAERAALADLEAAAVADDPSLAARLRGAPASRLRAVRAALQPAVLQMWKLILGLRWWGALIAAGGLALTVLGISTSLAVSVCGAVISAIGLGVLAEMMDRRPRRRPSSPKA